MLRDGAVSDHTSGLALEHLRTLSYAAAFIRGADEEADSIAVTLPAFGPEGERALEDVCTLAAAGGSLEVEISFSERATIVRLARPGVL